MCGLSKSCDYVFEIRRQIQEDDFLPHGINEIAARTGAGIVDRAEERPDGELDLANLAIGQVQRGSLAAFVDMQNVNSLPGTGGVTNRGLVFRREQAEAGDRCAPLRLGSMLSI
jgi:hypothetical protein